MIHASAANERSIYVTAGLAGGISLLFAIIVYLATGATLGLFFGGVVVVTILLPPMVLCEHAPLRQGITASAVNDAVGIVWLLAAILSRTTLLEWLQCYLLLAAYSFALWGVVKAIRSIGSPPVPASALTVMLAMLWLSWPIWLARAVDDVLIDWLVPAHPLLALNGVLTHLGIWSEQPIAYRQLMNLGQDVAYTLPESILSGVFVHVIAAGLFCAIAALRPERRVSQFETR